MGNFFSSNTRGPSSGPDPMIARLEARLAKLEQLDSDRDGNISPKELDAWKKQQERDLQAFRERIVQQEASRHQTVLLEKDTELIALKNELQSLQSLFKESSKHSQAEKERLVAALSSAQRNRSVGKSVGTADAVPTGALSEAQIRKFVEELLTDEKVNIGYLPDWVERQLYVNFFNLLIGLLRKTISSTSFQLIGHEVSMVMLPNPISEKEKTEPRVRGSRGLEDLDDLENQEDPENQEDQEDQGSQSLDEPPLQEYRDAEV